MAKVDPPDMTLPLNDLIDMCTMSTMLSYTHHYYRHVFIICMFKHSWYMYNNGLLSDSVIPADIKHCLTLKYACVLRKYHLCQNALWSWEKTLPLSSTKTLLVKALV